MRAALLPSVALLLLPVLPAAAAEKTPARAAQTSAPAPAQESNASDSPVGEGTAAGASGKGIVFGVNQLPTVGGFLHVSPVDSLRLNLGLGVTFKPDTGAQFGIDAAFRHHLMTGDLRPYFEGGIGFGYASDISFALQGGLGVEYYFVPRVSVSGTLGLALRFESGGKSISLPLATTGLLMNVYL